MLWTLQRGNIIGIACTVKSAAAANIAVSTGAATPTVTLNSKKHLSAPSPIDTGIEDDMRDDGEDNIFLESIRLLDDMRRKSVQSLAHVRTPPNRYRQRIKQTNENSGLQAPKTSPATDTTITEGALSPEWEPFPSTPSEQALNQQGAAKGNAAWISQS